MSLIYHPDAEAELIEAAQFYERRVPTLDAQFLDAADRGIGVIQEAPDRIPSGTLPPLTDRANNRTRSI